MGGSPYGLPAVETVAAVHARDIGVRELVDVTLDGISRVEPRLHAWAVLDREGALRQAELLDRRLTAGERLPLHGLPFGVKDIIDMAGLPTSAGFAPFQDRVPVRDAAIVARLRELGAIPLGKTHTTQFALADAAPTVNPYLVTHTPGGSSSGSGAAVGARMVPFALGTQTGGSVLRPAAYCGAVGFKPTFNWFPRDGVLPLAWSLDHLGLIARNVADTTLLFQALTGAPSDTPPASMPRIGLLVDFVERAEPEIAAHVNDAANRLRQAGAVVEELHLPTDFELLLAVHGVIMQSEMAAVHMEQLARHRDDYGPLLATEVDLGQLTPAVYDLKARRLRGKIRRELDTLLSTDDAWLLPTAAIQPPLLKDGSTGNSSFQAPWSLLGTPSISLPTGMSAAGLPIGLQLVGRRGHDRALLATASWVEAMLGPIEPPGLPG